ncbi:MAG: hypothetical protein JSU04_12375 [Bdellovibrionales bacterium]|nr:hypothetical protein [Bdellovibrionales bacterium]
MKSLKWLLTGFVALNLAACAFDKNSNTDTQKELENRAALMEKYSPILGVYRGTIQAGVSSQAVELSFYTVEKKIGQTANGEPKFLPALMVRYRNLSNVVDDVVMESTYLDQTSQVLMSTNDNSLGVSGIFNGETITGNVTRNGGIWGTINVSLVSRESSAPNDANDRAERNARLTKIYEGVVGTYKGKVDFPHNSSASDFNVTVTIVIDQVKDKDGYYVPALKADYTRENDPARNLALAMDVDYKPDTVPPYISLVSNEVRAEYSVTIAGTINNGVIDGTFTNKRAQRGTVRLVKR